MRRKLFIHILALAFFPLLSLAQDIHFSQFYETAILRNPALTGVFSDDYKFGVVYRNQWGSISNPFETGLVSGELRTKVKDDKNDFVSYGLLAYYDRAGSLAMQTLAIYPSVNYSKSLEDKYNSFLSVGFTGAYMQNSFSPDKATFNNQYVNNSFNPNNPTGETLPNPRLYNWDIGAGVSFASTAGQNGEINYVIGASGYHFSTPINSYYKNDLIRLQMRWNGNASVSWQIDETYSMQLQGNYMQQGGYNEIIGGGMLGWNRKQESSEDPPFAIFAGLFYRYQDAIIPIVKVKYKDYSFGVSYDVNVSTLRAASNLRGGFELTVFQSGLFTNALQDRGKTICPGNFY